MRRGNQFILIFSLFGLLLIAGCQQYFGQEARGQQVTPTTVYGGEVYVQSIITGKCRLVSRSADYYQLEQAGYYTSTAERCKGKMEGKQIQEISSDKLDLLQKIDVDDNGVIDNEDFFVFANYFGTVKGGGANEAEFSYDARYDFNDDGKIDNDDFFILSEHFGKKVEKKPESPEPPIPTASYVIQDIVPLGVNIAEDRQLGGLIAGEKNLGKLNLESLFYGEVPFQGKNYKISERLYLNKNKNITPQTSLTSSDDDYHENVVLEFEKAAMQYIYSFDQPIPIKSASKENPLDIDFLGKRLKIIGVESPNKIKGIRDVEYFLNKNTCASISSGKKMCLAQVGSNGDIVVHVGGVSGVIAAGKIQEIDGVKIVNEEQFYDSNPVGLSSAILVVKDEELVIQDGDGYPGDDDLCSWEDYKDPDCWKFIVKNMDADGATEIFNDVQKGIYYGANGPVLGLKNDFALNDDKDNPPGPGGCVRMPEKYLGVCFNGLNYEDYESIDLKIARLDIGFDSITREALVPPGKSANTAILLWSPTERNEFIVDLTAKGFTRKQGILYESFVGDQIWLSVYDRNAVGVYASEFGGNAQLLGWVNNSKSSEIIFVNRGVLGITEDVEKVAVNVHYDDTRINLDVKTYKKYSLVPLESLSSFWTLDSKKDVVGLGKIQSFEEAEELIWFSENNAVTLGTKDENHRTKAGIIIENPKAYGANDAIKLKIPFGILMANIAIKGRSQ